MIFAYCPRHVSAECRVRVPCFGKWHSEGTLFDSATCDMAKQKDRQLPQSFLCYSQTKKGEVPPIFTALPRKPFYLWKVTRKLIQYIAISTSRAVYMFRSTLEMNTHRIPCTNPVKLILKHHNLTQIYKYSQAASQSPQSLPSNQNLKPFATIPTVLIFY